jgi:phage N-6-adenine-methyltransferase
MSGDKKFLERKRPIDSDRWETPRHIFESLNKRFRFFLDAACTKDNCLCPNGFYFDLGDDGLTENWKRQAGKRFIWLNPPFSQAGLWVRKACESECNVVVIVQADTGTNWWHDFVAGKASEIIFYRGRVQFRHPSGIESKKGTPTKPTAVLIYSAGRGKENLESRHSYVEKPGK